MKSMLILIFSLLSRNLIPLYLLSKANMFKAGVQLKELPDTDEWTKNLTRVSLMHNQIEEIPSSHSPRCPNLSTLLLSCNYHLRFIADSFFLSSCLGSRFLIYLIRISKNYQILSLIC
jgi:disease resistance protein RPS2